MACRLKLTAFALALPLLAGATPFAQAQALPDPTRPPGNATYGGAVGDPEGGLQTIIRPAKQKPRALINGEIVTLGGMVGGVGGTQRLVAVNADNVVLMDADGRRETLTLTPGISKSPANSKLTAPR